MTMAGAEGTKESAAKGAAKSAEREEPGVLPQNTDRADFSSLISQKTHKYGDRVSIMPLRIRDKAAPPPVIDVVVDPQGMLANYRKIFRIFRKYNIVDFARLQDELTYRDVLMACSHAFLYIAEANPKEDPENAVTAENVTLTFFRWPKPEKLFLEMTAKGKLNADAEKGIYHVEGIADFPIQIVITSELEGPENTCYRAMTDHAQREDVEQIIRDTLGETDAVMRGYYRDLLACIGAHNLTLMGEIMEDQAMNAAMLEIYKDLL